MFAVDCVVSRIVGFKKNIYINIYFYFLNLHLDDIVLPWFKVTVNVWIVLRWPCMDDGM